MTIEAEKAEEALRIDISTLTGPKMVEHYNRVAEWLGKKPVNRFSDRMDGARRIQHLHVELRSKIPARKAQPSKPATAPISVEVSAAPSAPAPAVPSPEIVAKATALVKEGKARRRRQKVFAYPPKEELNPVAEGSMRAQVRDLLVKGATFNEVVELVGTFYQGDDKKRISERAYGFVRLLHTYVGYGLREEGEGENKKIFVVTPEEWNARRSPRTKN